MAETCEKSIIQREKHAKRGIMGEIKALLLMISSDNKRSGQFFLAGSSSGVTEKFKCSNTMEKEEVACYVREQNMNFGSLTVL